jgi:hypothetical protein
VTTVVSVSVELIVRLAIVISPRRRSWMNLLEMDLASSTAEFSDTGR